jgi:UDP-N-acetylmuramoyl-L-alanyl-D-glutamate--2,6-diaminopimelate ligase
MGKVASELADRVVVTSDNPRSEDPQAIIDQVLGGIDAAFRDRCDVCVDRRQAIETAIDEARGGDIVLIAGKGHETYQEIAGRRIDFSDVRTASEILKGRQEAK